MSEAKISTIKTKDWIYLRFPLLSIVHPMGVWDVFSSPNELKHQVRLVPCSVRTSPGLGRGFCCDVCLCLCENRNEKARIPRLSVRQTPDSTVVLLLHFKTFCVYSLLVAVRLSRTSRTSRTSDVFCVFVWRNTDAILTNEAGPESALVSCF